MDFTPSKRSREYIDRLQEFVVSTVEPAEATYAEQVTEVEHAHARQPPVMEELKAEARSRGLWNLWSPDPAHGPGLSNLEYAPLAELMGRSPIAPEACNSNAPDTGNMELLAQFGTHEQRQRWLEPLLAGEIRSAFAMTEPDVASSDATNIRLRVARDGDTLVLDGRKWWSTGALHPACRILVVMGKTDPDAPAHRQQSMVLVPIDTPGVEVVRSLPVFGYHDVGGHAEIAFDGVRVPASNLVGGEGDGFAIAQARLGPGRIHHCMRLLGAAERALELLCTRALDRVTFGRRLAERANVQDWIAEARVEIDMARLLVLETAWRIDTVGAKEGRTAVAAIKVAVPAVALRVLDRAIQIHGGAGVTDDVPLALLWAHARTLRIADGPDEVHKMTIARRELRRHDPQFRAT